MGSYKNWKASAEDVGHLSDWRNKGSQIASAEAGFIVAVSWQELGSPGCFECHFLGGTELRLQKKNAILVDFESYEISILDDMKKVQTEMKPLDCGA